MFSLFFPPMVFPLEHCEQTDLKCLLTKDKNLHPTTYFQKQELEKCFSPTLLTLSQSAA